MRSLLHIMRRCCEFGYGDAESALMALTALHCTWRIVVVDLMHTANGIITFHWFATWLVRQIIPILWSPSFHLRSSCWSVSLMNLGLNRVQSYCLIKAWPILLLHPIGRRHYLERGVLVLSRWRGARCIELQVLSFVHRRPSFNTCPRLTEGIDITQVSTLIVWPQLFCYWVLCLTARDKHRHVSGSVWDSLACF